MQGVNAPPAVGMQLLDVILVVERAVRALPERAEEFFLSTSDHDFQSTSVTRACAYGAIEKKPWAHLWLVLDMAWQANVLDAAKFVSAAGEGDYEKWGQMLASHEEMLELEVLAVIYLADKPSQFVNEVRAALEDRSLPLILYDVRFNSERVLVCICLGRIMQRKEPEDGHGDGCGTGEYDLAQAEAAVGGLFLCMQRSGGPAHDSGACACIGCKTGVERDRLNIMMVHALATFPPAGRHAVLRFILVEMERVDCMRVQNRGAGGTTEAKAARVKKKATKTTQSAPQEGSMASVAGAEGKQCDMKKEIASLRVQLHLAIEQVCHERGDNLILEEELRKARAAGKKRAAQARKGKQGLKPQSDERSVNTERFAQMQDMGVFECPIALGVMQDPVTLTSGNTYERRAITEWLARHDTDPLTNETLRSKNVVPNLVLRALIQRLDLD